MTEISKLGEFGLIDHLTKEIQIKNESTKLLADYFTYQYYKRKYKIRRR